MPETLTLEQLSFAAVASVPVQYDWGQEPEWETVFLPGAACPDCGHPNQHNRVGGCEFVLNWYGGEPERCPCLEYPDRPDDSERVWDTVCR